MVLANKLLSGFGTFGAPARRGIQGLSFSVPRGLAPFPNILNEDDLVTEGKTVSATDFTILGTKTVTAQQAIQVGQGGPNQPDNQGYIRVTAEDVASGAMAGKIRIDVSNSNATNNFTLMENRTDRLSVASTDRNLLVPLPAQFPIPTEDSLIKLLMKADTAANIGITDTVVIVPVTTWQ